MSFWERLKLRLRRGGGSPPADADHAPPVDDVPTGSFSSQDEGDTGAPPYGLVATPAARRDEGEIATLRRACLPGGPSLDEAIAILRRARGTVREADAVAHVRSALTERPLPDPLRVACADILAARGDEQAALRALASVSSTAGLVLAADLYASSGQLPRAVSTIERVLGRAIDAPGARERHRRWRAALGAPEAAPGRLDEATIVTADPARGPFRLLREVARGGAGAVYEAEDEVLGRRVAFKVYHGRGSDQTVLTREVRTAARLAGPGVVRVLDACPGEGWIALEWIGRGSVRDVMRAGDMAALLPIGRWARPLAAAIARVHAAGVVHADVKPANVLLRAPGEPVLGDFGIARGRGEPGDPGSPGYVSPERLAGRPSDPRDDIYGFGRVLEDALHMLRTKAAPALIDADDAAAAALAALAARCIGPDDERPADGAELGRALADIL